MELVQIFDNPIDGYWDGGPKNRFTWSLQGPVSRDKLGPFMKVGSWEANHWFMTSVKLDENGNIDEKATPRIVRRRLASRAKKAGKRCKFEIKEAWIW